MVTLVDSHHTMAEERIMKLISAENAGPTSVMFSFSKKPLDSADYGIPISKFTRCDIYKTAKIKILMDPVSENEICYSIQARKFALTKELKIQLHVVCKKPGYNSNLECTESWSKWQTMGNSSNAFFDVQINVIMSKLHSMVLKLYKDEEFTDFQLSTAEGSVAVHKAQMAGSSEVFKTMLSREWKETHEGCINMAGVTLQTLQHLKDYMYLGALPDYGLCPLLLIARCYLMDNLKADCLSKLSQTVKSENLYDLLEFSFFNKFPELTFVVLKAMSKSMVDDAHKNIIENEKSCIIEEADIMFEQEQSDEETSK